MELECEEEKSTVEMLTERVSRSRDQIDQLRSELMQERSSKQDLELDKNAMERQVRGTPPRCLLTSGVSGLFSLDCGYSLKNLKEWLIDRYRI